MTHLIEAENLYRYYNGHCAVADVSFTLDKGQVIGFLGPNGAGKTTTMQMLCGLLAPSSGAVSINGFDLLDQPKQAKRHLGYLPDIPPLYKDLTVTEFLTYCAKLHGLLNDGIGQARTRAMERCGLIEHSERLIGHLSKGFQQRVGIAQAILHNPDVIVLDEPTVGLDPRQIREIRSLIRELGQEHGVILSTHILTEVQESCTHVQIIHQGRLILHETIEGLNRHMDISCLEVVTDRSADHGLLASISGVQSIEMLAGNRIRIHHNSSSDPAAQIAEILISRGYRLEELKPVKQSMEDIFIALTRETDEPHA